MSALTLWIGRGRLLRFEGRTEHDHPGGCTGKRPVLTGTFYPARLRDNVELVPHAVASVAERGVVDEVGVEHPADVLVLVTGFQPTNYLSNFDVIGRGGISLREKWDPEPSAFLASQSRGFPTSTCSTGPIPTAVRSSRTSSANPNSSCGPFVE